MAGFVRGKSALAHSVREGLISLDILSAGEQLPEKNTDTFADVVASLLEELDETFTYVQGTSYLQMQPSIQALFHSQGLVFPTSSAAAVAATTTALDEDISHLQVLQALVQEVQISRITAVKAKEEEKEAKKLHSETQSTSENPSSVSCINGDADTALCTSVSRACNYLNIDPEAHYLSSTGSATGTRNFNILSLRSLLSAMHACILKCNIRASNSMQLVSTSIARSLTSLQKEKLSGIACALSEEFLLRKEMLLRRLEVTCGAFLRSERASTSMSASSWEARVKKIRLDAMSCDNKRVSLYEALVAREYVVTDLLHRDVHDSQNVDVDVHAHSVKNALMGSVPDRGGRVGKAAKLLGNLDMPAFRERTKETAKKGSHHHRKGKGKRGGKGKNR